MSTSKLFSEYKLGSITLKNRVVMAPMTRSRAIDNIPNALMATYYGQRSEAGLIITEGVSPSPNGLGYSRIPGAFSEAQTAGWKQTAENVHANGAKIFMQLMHTGRVTHIDNLPEGAEVLAPSAITLAGDMYVDGKGMLPHTTPKEMTKSDIDDAIAEYVTAAKNAIAAGFDGVELHGANGYLIDQFINPISNQRTDEYGGNIENRSRFVIEVAKAVVAAIGKEHVGLRVSPYGAFNGLGEFEELEEEYGYIASQMSEIGIAYMHIVDHSSQGAPEVKDSVKQLIRKNFNGAYILSGGYNKERAEADLEADKGELVAFGVPFIANPDLVTRMKEGIELAAPDQGTFYTPGEQGYTDYPTAK